LWSSEPAFIGVQLLVGIARGMGYFFAASGLTLAYGVLRIINFAHGTFFMVGAYLAYSVTVTFGPNLGYWLAMILVPIGVAGLGIVIEVVFIRRFYLREHAYQILLTFTFILIIGELTRMIWGADIKGMFMPSSLAGSVLIGNNSFPIYYLWMIGLGGLVAVVIWFLLYKTEWGGVTRAAAADAETAQAMGVNVRKVFTLVFAFSSFLAGLGGVVMAPVFAIAPGLDMDIILLCFIIVIVGGLGSIAGALASALIIGVVYALGVLIVPELAMAFLFLVMIAVLTTRPHGLLGRKISD